MNRWTYIIIAMWLIILVLTINIYANQRYFDGRIDGIELAKCYYIKCEMINKSECFNYCITKEKKQ